MQETCNGTYAIHSDLVLVGRANEYDRRIVLARLPGQSVQGG